MSLDIGLIASYAPQILKGLGVTLMLWIIGSALGLAVGFIVAVGRRYGPAPLGWLLRAIVEIIRGTPFLIQEFAGKLPTPPSEIKEYVSFNEAYADLAAGRIVAVANSYPNIAYVAKERPEVFALVEPPFGAKTYFGFPGRKDPEYKTLMDAIDAAILKMKADGRLGELQKKWFGVTFDTPDAVTEAAF